MIHFNKDTYINIIIITQVLIVILMFIQIIIVPFNTWFLLENSNEIYCTLK